MWYAIRLIIGSPANWAMVAGGWMGDLMDGMLDGAIMFYRSELLITAQKVASSALGMGSGAKDAAGRAATALAAGGSSSSDGPLPLPLPLGGNVPVDSLIQLVAAIVLSELARIVVQDIKQKMDDLGEKAIRRRLELLLGERLLAQDLETHDENSKANECSWGLSPQAILRSFPIENFIAMPSTVVRAWC